LLERTGWSLQTKGFGTTTTPYLRCFGGFATSS
jgi:hypothetical protein